MKGFTDGLLLLLLQCLLFIPSNALEPGHLVVVVLSQANPHHAHLAAQLRSDLRDQARGSSAPRVHLLHRDFARSGGGWTIFPLLPQLDLRHGSNEDRAVWFFFCEDRTRIHLKNLLRALEAHDHSREVFLGHPLKDQEATIIHHFAFFQQPNAFTYPDFALGFTLSKPLLKRLVQRQEEEGPPQLDFSIDPKHELAVYIWEDGKGIALTPLPQLCLKEGERDDCATSYRPFQPCGPPIPSSHLLFAVKTCAKFHQERVPIVKGTWAPHATHLEFYSEVEDGDIPTVKVDIPNVSRGHCRKTFAILNRTAQRQDLPDVRWLVLVDDDTILSVGRLRRLLSCYNSSEPVVLGERYGFRVFLPEGYNYVTGGGGIVLSMGAVTAVTSASHPSLSPPASSPARSMFPCHCPSADSPDDMHLGACLQRIGLPPPTHSPLFHQARPLDYSVDFLSHEEPISFHKHWMLDPRRVYEDWFALDDQVMSDRIAVKEEETGWREHTEL